MPGHATGVRSRTRESATQEFSIRRRRSADDRSDDHVLQFRIEMEEDPPVAHAAPQPPLLAGEKLDVALKWSGRHFLQGGVNPFQVASGNPFKLLFCGTGEDDGPFCGSTHR